MSNEDLDPVIVKSSWFWIKDSKGNASVSTTFISIAFLMVTIAYTVGMVEKIGPVSFRPFDVAACTSYFIPLMGLYWARRHSEIKALGEQDK